MDTEPPFKIGDPVTVRSTLQAAEANWATPHPAKMVKDNAISAGYLRGGAFIMVGLKWHIEGETCGFTINQVFNGVTTSLFTIINSNVPIWGQERLWRPLNGPIVTSGTTAVNGGRIALALEGTPAAGSWLELSLLHHFDVGLSGRWTATGSPTVFTG
jgi:hypothetical protein